MQKKLTPHVTSKFANKKTFLFEKRLFKRSEKLDEISKYWCEYFSNLLTFVYNFAAFPIGMLDAVFVKVMRLQKYQSWVLRRSNYKILDCIQIWVD